MNTTSSGFDVLCDKFLTITGSNGVRSSTLRRYNIHYRNLERHLENMPVSDITYSVLEDMKLAMSDHKPKTVYDAFGFLKSFLNWCVKRDDIPLEKLPTFPELSKRMGMRKVLDKDTQRMVVSKVKEISTEPRAYIGILLLATYPKIRPGELRQVTDDDIDLAAGYIRIPQPKEQNEPKLVKLTEKHTEMLRRETSGYSPRYLLSYSDGRPLGRDYLKNLWARACRSLGIEGVPLYPGTKHTSATDLAKKFPYKLVKEAAGISSKAMERYINITEDDVVVLYESASVD